MTTQSRETDILTEQVRLIYQQLPGVIFIPSIGAMVLSALHWGYISNSNIIIWCSLEIAFTSGTASIAYFSYKKYQHLNIAPYVWANILNAIGFLSGVAWASSAFFLYSQENLILQLVLILYLYSASSLTALSMTAYKNTFYCVATPMLAGIGIRLALDFDSLHILLALTTLLFMVALYTFYFYVNQGFVDSIRLWFEKNDLAKQLELRSIEAEKDAISKSRFLAAASHDLRQPLIAQDLLLNALQNGLGNNYNCEIFNKLKSNINSLHGLFNELVEVSRIDTGNISTEKTEIELNHLLNKMKQQFLPLAQDKNILLSVNSFPVKIVSDKNSLERILQNLISNAIKYTDKGRVNISLTEIDNHIKIHIEDTGIGIGVDEQDLIFDEFYRSDTTRNSIEGFGLGLAIVKRLNHLLDHDLQLESCPGTGSSFSLVVPIAE